jgi:hypothetical protein
VLVLLVAVCVFLALTTWREIGRLFGTLTRARCALLEVGCWLPPLVVAIAVSVTADPRP